MSSSNVTYVTATGDEVTAGTWHIDNIRKIVEGMHNDGLVILEDVINPEHLDEINKFMVQDALEIRKKATRLNFGTENIQQGPPLQIEQLNYSDIYSNKLLFEAVTFILGPGARWDFVSGNTALPRSDKRQPVHADNMTTYLNSTYYLIANIPLIDFSPENGVTELWPGSHQCRKGEYFTEHSTIKLDALEDRRKIRAPVQPIIKKGSIVLRDLTLWHCGMPNPSDQVRCMIGLGFSAKWWKNDTDFRVPNAKLQEEFTNAAKSEGIIVRSVVSEDFEAEKDFHDFQLQEPSPEEIAAGKTDFSHLRKDDRMMIGAEAY